MEYLIQLLDKVFYAVITLGTKDIEGMKRSNKINMLTSAISKNLLCKYQEENRSDY